MTKAPIWARREQALVTLKAPLTRRQVARLNEIMAQPLPAELVEQIKRENRARKHAARRRSAKA